MSTSTSRRGILIPTALLSATLALVGTATAQTAYLVKDINTTAVTPIASSSPTYARYVQSYDQYRFVQMGGYTYFAATTYANGQELWRTDGTAAGTTMVADINAGASSSSPYYLTVVGSKLFFRANDGTNGTELWVTDGTAAGTTMVADVWAGSSSSSPSYIARLGTGVVFSANDGTNGTELWTSDGTAAGTKLVKDIYAGASSSSPLYCMSSTSGSKVYFRATEATSGAELWVTDGTAAGTNLVLDIYAGTSSSSPTYLQPFGVNGLVFGANDGTTGTEAWVTDGTAAGTSLLKDIYTGTSSGATLLYSVSLGAVPSKIIFRGYDATNGYEWWVTDGTSAGTVMLADIAAGTGTGSYYYGCTDAAGTKAYLSSYNGSVYQIWESDGTPAGTKVFAASMGTSYAYYLEEDGTGRIFFSGNEVTAGTGREPCITDGTAAGTTTIVDVYPGTSTGYGYYMTRIAKGQVVFYGYNPTSGYELWISDGTAAGTSMIKDINVWTFGTVTANDGVAYIEKMFGKVMFYATDGTSGYELWSSDGTAAGTTMVKDIYAGSSSSSPSYKARLGNNLIFAANDGTNGTELWISDGTAAGTTLLKDIYAGSSSGSPAYLERIGDKVFFYAQDGTNGYELWTTDGTAAGTAMVKDIYVGTGGSYPKYFVELNGKAYFQATDGTTGYELFESDGTAAGTKLVADIYAGTSSSSPNYFALLNGKMYFYATTAATGYELFESDGTTAGTKLVLDINPGTGSSSPAYKAAQNGKLWFYANDGTNGIEMWESDGTAANTKMIGQFAYDLAPYYVTAVGSRRIYFSGMTAAAGRELRLFDTTVSPYTIYYFDLNSGGDSSPYNFNGNYNFAVEGGSVWFQATRTPQTDNQLWYATNGGTAQSIGRSSGSTWLTATDPLINTTMKITGGTSVSNAIQVLILGVPTNAPVGAFGGFVYFDGLQPFLLLGTVAGTSLSASILVPNDTTLVGTSSVLQNWGLDAMTFPNGTELSNGVHLTVGNTW